MEHPARLDINHVSAGYGNIQILKELTFQVPHGGQVAVVGPNGAGKSTLFRVLVGLLPLKRGNIFIHGLPLGHHQDCVAYVPQRGDVDWKFPVTVRDVVMMGRYGKIGWMSRPSKQDQEIVAESIHQLGISKFINKPIGELSGGQQQRVFLARAIAQQPHILLMDEPFTGVDIGTQETALNLLEELHKQGVTVMVSTHDLNMAAERFKLVLLLNRTMIAFGPPSDVLTPEKIRTAFGGKVLFINGAVVVDECCPPADQDNSGA
ncbi:MAG: metal ABC transporter ATP-binding protein [Anaerolineaceae bacterium]|nr:metal ABC transporter ATP-binding protein [Anaerolineaceae bacterium]